MKLKIMGVPLAFATLGALLAMQASAQADVRSMSPAEMNSVYGGQEAGPFGNCTRNACPYETCTYVATGPGGGFHYLALVTGKKVCDFGIVGCQNDKPAISCGPKRCTDSLCSSCSILPSDPVKPCN